MTEQLDINITKLHQMYQEHEPASSLDEIWQGNELLYSSLRDVGFKSLHFGPYWDCPMDEKRLDDKITSFFIYRDLSTGMNGYSHIEISNSDNPEIFKIHVAERIRTQTDVGTLNGTIGRYAVVGAAIGLAVDAVCLLTGNDIGAGYAVIPAFLGINFSLIGKNVYNKKERLAELVKDNFDKEYGANLTTGWVAIERALRK
jgi:hypothetical protein